MLLQATAADYKPILPGCVEGVVNTVWLFPFAGTVAIAVETVVSHVHVCRPMASKRELSLCKLPHQ